jgi:hypothetical protein
LYRQDGLRSGLGCLKYPKYKALGAWVSEQKKDGDLEVSPNRLSLIWRRTTDIAQRITARAIFIGQLTVVAAVFAFFNSSVSAEEALPSDAGNSLLSRITVEVPLYTRHFPQDAGFNDHNWGAMVDVALSPDWSILLGDITNSYYRNTAIAGARYSIYAWDFPSVKIDTGVMLGFDLNGGYRDRSDADPLLGALSIKITGNHFSEYDMLNRTGVVFTVIPGKTFAINVALAFGL